MEDGMVENSERTPLHFGDAWWGNLSDPFRQLAAKVADFFAPAAEASRTEDAYEICIELPGVSEDDISVSIDHNMLTVSGEKKFAHKREGRDFFFSEFSYGKFQRSFRLPDDADQDGVKATYKDGLLSLHIGKKAPGKSGKTIKIAKG